MRGDMVTRICDRCGKAILKDELRYVAKVEVYAAYDPLEITFEGRGASVTGPHQDSCLAPRGPASGGVGRWC